MKQRLRFFSAFSQRSRSLSTATREQQAARVIVVGNGRMGQIRAELVKSNPRYELCGIVDPAFSHDQCQSKGFKTPLFQSLTDAIHTTSAKNNLDGIVVSSPTFTHAAVVREACEHRLSVFTEKPVDENAEKIAALFDCANAAGIFLCCGFQRRFDPSYVAATQAVIDGRVGRPVMASLFFADHPIPPRQFLLQDGNIFKDLLAHDADFIIHTLQDQVVSVYAKGTSSDAELEAAGVHDNATVVLTFRKGAVATFFMSRSASYGYDQRCEIFGDGGLVSVGNMSANATVISNQSGVHQSRLQHSFAQRFREGFGLELDAFCDVLIGGKEWPVSAEQCIQVQKVADAARVSAEVGKVVEMDPV